MKSRAVDNTLSGGWICRPVVGIHMMKDIIIIYELLGLKACLPTRMGPVVDKQTN
jgi:hypothetical protein